MSKRLIFFVLLSCIILTGCVSKAEFDALEERVSKLEGSTQEQVDGVSDQADPDSLISYVENWDEVEAIIGEALGKEDFTITSVEYTDGDANNSIETYKTFGNGKLAVYADGILFRVTVRENLAESVGYSDGASNYYEYTPSCNPFD